MTTPHPAKNAALCPTTRALIHAEWLSGRNTCEIGRALDLPEALVAEAVRAERERRTADRMSS